MTVSVTYDHKMNPLKLLATAAKLGGKVIREGGGAVDRVVVWEFAEEVCRVKFTEKIAGTKGILSVVSY
jgi:hypothetical protein